MIEPAPALLDDSQASASNLTQRQLLMWVQEQLNPEVPSNNMVMSFEIEGDLDPERFQRAFGSVVAEFDALRSVFANDENGVPQQHVLDAWDGEVELVDLSGRPDPRSALEDWLDARSSRPFALSECAFDCALVRLGSSSWLWYFCQNHIITDGHSFALIYRYVAERYASPDASLPAAACFTEYRAIERKYRESERAAASAAFWNEKLRETLEPLAVYGRDHIDGGPTLRRITLDLGPERSGALRRLAASPKNRAVTADMSLSLLFTTLMAAFLHRVSGNSRIGIGMPVLNRRVRTIRNAIGPLLEVIAIHVDVEKDDSFLSLFERTRNETYAVMRHAQFGVPAQMRAFEAMLNFHPAPFSDFCGMPTRTASYTGLNCFGESPPAYDHYWRSGEEISLQIQDFDGTDTFKIDFDLSAAVFADGLAERAVGHFERLLEAMLLGLDAKIHDVDIVGSAERDLVLHGFNSKRGAPSESTLLDALEGCFEAHAERAALRFGSKELSYRQLDERSAEIAAQLIASGVARGDKVAVLLERSEELPVALLGVMRAGAAYVPVDPEHPVSRNSMILEDAEPRVLLTQSSLASMLEPGPDAVLLCLDRLEACEPSGPLPRPELTDLAYVLFTSGSTGRPKGVQITHANLMNFLVAMLDEPGMSAEDVVICVTTVGFDIVGLDMYVTWLAGALMVLADRSTALDPRRLQALLERSDATVLQATPATWRMLIDEGWRGKSNLRALIGGEALTHELADDLLEGCAELWNLYGPTETTVWCSTEKVEPAAASEKLRPIPIGRPIQNQRMYVLDEQRRPVPIGLQGEIWIAGAGVGPGYCARPDLTDAVFHADPFVPGERMYSSGDLGRRRMDGRIEYMGRTDHQVKVRGFRVELGEIERVIDAEASINECVVLARPDSIHGNRLSAYLTAHGDTPPDIPSLRARLRDQLPAYMVPVDFIVLDAMPLTTNGKISRADLPEPEASRPELGFDYVAPATPVESSIARIWSSLLGLDQVGVHDSFFDLGGTSLAAISLFRQLERELGIDLPIATLFEATTIRKLAALVERGEAGELDEAWSTVVPIQPEGRRIPLFCAAGAGGNIHNLQRLAKHLGFDQPFHGLQTRGVRGGQVQHECVEDIARESIADMKQVQPQGPYVLAGYSAGGSVAFEMAKQLREEGQEIAGLILLDSYSPMIPRRSRVERLMLHGSRLHREGPGYLGRKFLDRIAGDAARLREATQHLRARLFPERYAHESFMLRRIETQMRYQPDPYAGSAILFRVDRSIETARTELAIDDFNGWLPLIEGGLEVMPAPGGHLDMCEEPHVGVLAEQLSQLLDQLNEAAGTRRDASSGADAAKPQAEDASESQAEPYALGDRAHA